MTEGLDSIIKDAKKGQLTAIQCLSGPLLISAGAGTGKTFTLTWRIANALASDEPGTPRDVGEMLVITYTRKAAGELVTRIRRALGKAGLEEQVLAMDGAWVSTIHSMCMRILRRKAFLVGLDPFFTKMGTDDRNIILGQAMEEVYGEIALDERFAPLTSGMKSDAFLALAGNIHAKISNMPSWKQRVCLGPVESPCELLARYMPLFEEQAAGFEAVSRGWKTKTAADAVEIMGARAASADELFDACSTLASDEAWKQMLAWTNDLVDVKKMGKNEEYKSLVDEERETMDTLRAEVLCNARVPLQRLILEFVDRLDKRFAELKEQADMVDDDDLLLLTHKLMTEHPEVAEEYAERFKLVMVDEFQDTNQLQIQLIEALCDAEERKLCTVGDEEQSIYRFRGADVSVYREHKEHLRKNPHHTEARLEDNFRSHGDVLTAVNTLFSQPSMFGDECLKLGHGRDEEKVRPRLPEGFPRVRLLVTEGNESTGGTSVMRQFQARWIAKRFAELRKYYEPGQMAILLRSMSQVKLYAEALQEQNLDCVQMGGSHFYEQTEVAILTLVLRAIANPYDEIAYMTTLASPLFDMDDDCLLRLRLCKNAVTTENSHANYDDALERLTADGGVGTGAMARWNRMCELGRRGNLARALEVAFEGSPWEGELLSGGVEGRAKLANIMKFIDTTAELERRPGMDARMVAQMFERARAGAGDRQGEGSLSMGGQNAVTLMTVHGSKGLEFPVVAVADCLQKGRSDSCGSNGVTVVEDHEHIHMDMNVPDYAFKDCSKLTEALKNMRANVAGGERTANMRITENSSAQHSCSVNAWDSAASFEEKQRLLYVACTRARDVLLVPIMKNGPGLSRDDLQKAGACIDDVASAFFADGAFPDVRSCEFPLGGPGVPGPCGLYEHYLFKKGEDDVFTPVLVDGDEVLEPPVEQAGSETSVCHDAGDEGVDLGLYDVLDGKRERERFSYTALSPFDGHHDANPEVPEKRTEATDGQDDDGLPAMSFGLAFHLLAQAMAESRSLERPADSRVCAVMGGFGLPASDKGRLEAAVDNWRSSQTAVEMYGKPVLASEMPFTLHMEAQEGKFLLTGSIDLMARDVAGQRATIVDYKSGTTDGSVEEGGLEGRYRLQASCYALALLRQGVREVDVVYVRPEVLVGGKMQTVRPLGQAVHAADMTDLEGCICEAWRRWRGKARYSNPA